MAAYSTLAAAPGADNEDLLDARDASHEIDSDAARTTEGDGPQTHPAARLVQVSIPMSGALADPGTTDHPHNPYHRYLSHIHHRLQLHDHKPRLILHRPHSKTLPNASGASTPSQTRSASSSVYTISSTFPSSAPVQTPIDGPSLHVIETGADCIETPSSNDRNFRAQTDPPNKIAVSHDVQAQPGSLIEPSPLSTVSSQDNIPLSTPPPASIPSQARRTEWDSGASRESPSQSLPQQELSRSRDGEAHDNYIDCHQEESEAESIDSQALALDQTRLRIAYLVSTMVTPSANVPADTTASGAAAGAGDDAKDAGCLASSGPVPLYGYDEPASQEASEVGHYMEQCPKGWTHIAPARKRDKVTQILCWQSEVAELGDAVFCSCSVGTATPYDENGDSGVQPRSLASSEAGMARLSTVVSGVTTIGTSAAGFDRSSTASPSSSMSAPSSSLTSYLSSSPSLRASLPCCHGCKKLLMPPRTVVFVSSSSDDFPWIQRAEDGGGSNSGFRKALRAIRGIRGIIIGLSRRKKDKCDPGQNGLQNPDVAKIANSGGGSNALFFAVPADLSGIQFVGPTSPILNQRKKSIPEAKVWDLWEQTNCNALRDHVDKDEWALFFPATEMYCGLRRGAEGDDRDSEKIHADAEADADANIDDIINGDDDDDDDDDGDDAHAKERRRKREMAERLQRAQALLEQHQ